MEIVGSWAIDDNTMFPIGFFDIGGKTFEWVFENKTEFREHILQIREATGLWKAFQDYVIHKMEFGETELLKDRWNN